MDGRWLVSSVRRSLFNSAATVTLRKPQPRLPEPKAPNQIDGASVPPVASRPGNPPLLPPTPKGPQGPLGRYYFPVPAGVTFGDGGTDMGWDIESGSGNVGKPLLAVGDGHIGVIRSAGDFGPNYIVLILKNPIDYRTMSESVDPRAGHAVYYGHCGEPIAHEGQPVRAGEPITRIAGIVPTHGPGNSMPGHMELGWANPEDGNHYTMLAISSGSCPGGFSCPTPEGRTFRSWALQQPKMSAR